MSAETWLDDNSRYLAASLQWLRLRLQAMARQDGSTSAPAPAPSAKPGLFARLRGASGGALAPAPVEPAVPDDKATAGLDHRLAHLSRCNLCRPSKALILPD
jgi:hypothetical protein